MSTDRLEAIALQAALLLSTARVATSLGQAARERRSGRDPSAQEDAAFVRGFLADAAAQLQHDLMRLRAAHVHARVADDTESEGVAAWVRQFDGLSSLHRLIGHLQTVHQRLLSLYPAVDAGLVEEARIVRGQGRTFVDTEVPFSDVRWGGFIENALAFALRLEQVAG